MLSKRHSIEAITPYIRFVYSQTSRTLDRTLDKESLFLRWWTQKYTPTDCFFCNFSHWADLQIEKSNNSTDINSIKCI